MRKLTNAEAEAEAWKEWIEGEEGAKSSAGQAAGQYLRNRLWRAFMAGANAQRIIRSKTDSDGWVVCEEG